MLRNKIQRAVATPQKALKTDIKEELWPQLQSLHARLVREYKDELNQRRALTQCESLFQCGSRLRAKKYPPASPSRVRG